MQMQTLEAYIDQSNRGICQATVVFDLARAAEKMTDPNCVGRDNNVWRNGPYLSSPANLPDMDHSYPYIIHTSLETRVTAGLIYRGTPLVARNGGVPIPLPEVSGSRVEPYVAKMVIIEQFEILKEFLDGFNGPTNKKRSQQWVEKVGPTAIERMKVITDRRNELTHERQHPVPSMKEAVEYFCECRNLAVIFFEAHRRRITQG